MILTRSLCIPRPNSDSVPGATGPHPIGRDFDLPKLRFWSRVQADVADV